MKMREFFISEVETLTAKIPVDIKWGEFFGHDSGFCIRLSEKYFMSVFLGRRLTLKGIVKNSFNFHPPLYDQVAFCKA